ncbi:hypothetical protein BD413DRAFT_68285 [Trametes elegans]|nr:hypothetical protein BD413DRAFT_68285 [Trametes elegans]
MICHSVAQAGDFCLRGAEVKRVRSMYVCVDSGSRAGRRVCRWGGGWGARRVWMEMASAAGMDGDGERAGEESRACGVRRDPSVGIIGGAFARAGDLALASVGHDQQAEGSVVVAGVGVQARVMCAAMGYMVRCIDTAACSAVRVWVRDTRRVASRESHLRLDIVRRVQARGFAVCERRTSTLEERTSVFE